MGMNKPKNPGDVIGVRLPKETPEEVIQWINKPRDETLSSYCADILVDAIKQRIKEENNQFTHISLPIKLPNEIVNKLKQPDVLNLVTEMILRLLSDEPIFTSLSMEDGDKINKQAVASSRNNVMDTQETTDQQIINTNQEVDAFEKLLLKK
ncbi:hypothetical protein FOA22_13515 [Heyndrickxia oleronia]|uniref:hypothetical protein n=1 Tax=Heyndrickxia oleronia TaxID=38875 RepID=UPI003337021C